MKYKSQRNAPLLVNLDERKRSLIHGASKTYFFFTEGPVQLYEPNGYSVYHRHVGVAANYIIRRKTSRRVREGAREPGAGTTSAVAADSRIGRRDLASRDFKWRAERSVSVARRSRFDVTFHALKSTVGETAETFRASRTAVHTPPRPGASGVRGCLLFKRGSRAVRRSGTSLGTRRGGQRALRHGTFRNNVRAARRRGGIRRRSHAPAVTPGDVFPARARRANDPARRSRTFNKNHSTPFERSSPRSLVRHSYVPIGRTRSGDGAAARLPLAAAGRTVNGCGRAGQSRRTSAANVLPRRSLPRLQFFFFSNCPSPFPPPGRYLRADRFAIADRTDR